MREIKSFRNEAVAKYHFKVQNMLLMANVHVHDAHKTLDRIIVLIEKCTRLRRENILLQWIIKQQQLNRHFTMDVSFSFSNVFTAFVTVKSKLR